MGAGVTHHTRKVFFQIPAHMVDQPVDFGGELHIAFDVDRGFLPTGHSLRQCPW